MKTKLFFPLSILIIAAYSTLAQTKVTLEPQDKITMLNGDEKAGKVTEIVDDGYKFIHHGETVVYVFKRGDINKVQFASGRIEFVTTATTPAYGKDGLRSYQNKLAILPFIYIVDVSKGERMEFKVQSEAYNLLKESASQLSIQDPAVTNDLIAKQGITAANYTGYTPGEVADILGVEYIVMGSVTIQSASAVIEESPGKKGAKVVEPVAVPASSQYSAKVDLRVYDRGQMLFSQAHLAYWPTPENYVLSLRYLLKRTPVFKK